MFTVMKKLLYLHGFASSGSSGTVHALRDILFTKRKELGEVEVIAPDIPVSPVEAVQFLERLCSSEKPDLVLGTSMGGEYAQQMFGVRRVCVNPGFSLSKMRGILFPGWHEWLNNRADGATKFLITRQTIKEFADMEKRQFDGAAGSAPCIALFGSEDDICDWRESKRVFDSAYGRRNSIVFEGGHRLNDKTLMKSVLPAVIGMIQA